MYVSSDFTYICKYMQSALSLLEREIPRHMYVCMYLHIYVKDAFTYIPRERERERHMYLYIYKYMYLHIYVKYVFTYIPRERERKTYIFIYI